MEFVSNKEHGFYGFDMDWECADSPLSIQLLNDIMFTADPEDDLSGFEKSRLTPNNFTDAVDIAFKTITDNAINIDPDNDNWNRKMTKWFYL